MNSQVQVLIRSRADQWRSQTDEVAWACFRSKAPGKIPHLLIIYEGHSLNQLIDI